MKKGIVIILIGIVFYILLAILGLNFLSSFDRNIYISNTKWFYKSGKWQTKLIDTNLNLEKYHLNVAYTFDYKGKYDLKYSNNEWYYKDRNNYKKIDDIIAYKGSKINLYKFDIGYKIDDQVKSEILKQIKINNASDFSLEEKIVIDIDNDGNDEIIYALSNIYSENSDNKFSVIAIYDDDKYEIVKSQINSNEILLHVYAIMDIDGDKDLDIVIISEGFSMTGDTYIMYENKNGKYIEIK